MRFFCNVIKENGLYGRVGSTLDRFTEDLRFKYRPCRKLILVLWKSFYLSTVINMVSNI